MPSLYNEARSMATIKGPKSRVQALIETLPPAGRSQVTELLLGTPRVAHTVAAKVLNKYYPDFGPFKGDQIAYWRQVNEA